MNVWILYASAAWFFIDVCGFIICRRAGNAPTSAKTIFRATNQRTCHFLGMQGNNGGTMNNRPKQNNTDSLTWGDYKRIAAELQRNHPNEDVMMLRRDKIISLIQDIPHFDDGGLKPTPYMLDDIRFEWFFLKKGNGENESFWRLKSSF